MTHSAIMAWRDEAALTAMVLMHDAAAAAMQIWDKWPNGDTVPNTIGAFMTGWPVRAHMRQAVDRSIYKWAEYHQGALKAVDHRLEDVSGTFRDLEDFDFIPPNEQPDHEELPGFGWSAATVLVGFTPLRWVPAARSQIFAASRRACLVELSRTWLNPSSDSGQSSFLANLLNRIDHTSRKAMEIVK